MGWSYDRPRKISIREINKEDLYMTTILTVVLTLTITIIGAAILLGYIALIKWLLDVADRWMDRKIDKY